MSLIHLLEQVFAPAPVTSFSRSGQSSMFYIDVNVSVGFARNGYSRAALLSVLWSLRPQRWVVPEFALSH